jgi:hypothetical protein
MLRYIILNTFTIALLFCIGCKNEFNNQNESIYWGQTNIDEILQSIDTSQYIDAKDAKMLFSDSETDMLYLLFFNSSYFDSSDLIKKTYLQTSAGQKLLVKYDSARVRLIEQKQYFEFPIEFTRDYDIEQKSYFYLINSQAYTTIDLQYQIIQKDTIYYLNEEQSRSIIEEGMAYQKSQSRIFKDRCLPEEFVKDIHYNHKHPTLENKFNQEKNLIDYSKILVSRLYKMPVEETFISDLNEGEIKMTMSFNYTGNIIDDYAEIRNLEIKVLDQRNEIIFSKRY